MRKLLSVPIFLCGLCFLTGCGSTGNSAPPPPAVATHFSVTGTTPQVIGTSFNITVSALDASNNVVTAYAGMVHFSSSDPLAVLPNDSPLANGTGTFPVTLKTAPAATVTVTDTTKGSISGTSNSIQVSAPAAARFSVSTVSSASSGTPFNFTVTALDASNNTVATYAGTVHFTSTDGQAVLPANATLTSGTGTFSATLKTVGSQTIKANDTVTVSITGSSNSISVSPTARATHFSVTAPASVTAGTAFNFTVTALDASNNTVITYAGTIHFTSTDGQAALPANSTLTNGTATFSATPKTIGAQTITATDTATGSIIGTSNTINVSAPGTLTTTSGAPPNGTVGQTYGGTFSILENHCLATFSGWRLDATGGTSGYHWSWLAAPGSSLPPGLAVGVETYTCGGSTRCCVTVSSPPLIHGTPTAAGTYHVIVTVTDSGSPAAQASANYTIVISNPSSAGASKVAAHSSPEQHVRYKAIDVGTLGGPNSNTALPFFDGLVVPSLSQTGIFAGQAETSTPDPFAPNCINPDCFVTNAIKTKGDVTTDLGALPGPAGLSSATTWIGGNGLIAGISLNGVIDPFTSTPATHGVVWKHDKITDLGVLEGGYESVAIAINSSGDVAGFANNAIPDLNSLAGLGSQTRAVVWRKGVIHDLGTLGGTDAVALYVNDLAQIVGESYMASSVPPPSLSCGDSPLTQHGFFWENGKMTDLDTLGGSCTFAYALNNRGQVVGQSTLAGDNTSHPFLWQKGTMKDLGALGGNYGYAGWLNDAGEVVGAASNQGEQALLAFLWKNGAMSNLATLNGDSCSVADAINSNGQVVGGSGVLAPFFPACTDAVEHAVLWENGQALDLNLLVTSASDLTLNEATSLNDAGEISGFGTLGNGDTRAFVLIPCDPNHPNVDGCDYEPVEAVPGLQVRPAQVTQASGASPAELSLPKMLTRFRSLPGGRNLRSPAPTAMLNDGGELDALNSASAANIEPAPTNLTSFAFKRGLYDAVELSWTDHSIDADSYHIERCTGSSCTNFSEIAVTGGSATRYIDAMWPMHLTFRYRVRAHGPSGYSGYSNIRTQTTP